MAQNQNRLFGEEALQLLGAHSSGDLKRTRLLVEEAAALDISSYFKGAGYGALNPSLCSTLTAAAIAGGQLGFNNLVARLASSSVQESEQEKVANEILEVVSPLAKILNYARFRVGAIQSYVAQCDIPSLKLQTMLLSKTDFETYQTRVIAIKKAELDDDESIFNWTQTVDELCEFLSSTQMEVTKHDENISSKSKKGSVSTKSISSYSKHWNSYASEILCAKLGIRWRGNFEETINGRISSLDEYKSRSWSQIQKDLNETITTRRAFATSKKKSKSKYGSSKLITEEKNLSGRLLTLTFNASGIDEDLIQPALNSIKGQLIRSKTKEKISVSMKTENSSLSIDIEKPSKDDLETIEVLLNSHR